MLSKMSVGMILVMCSMAMLVSAAEEDNKKIRKKEIATSTKCWKRITPLEHGDADGNDPICRDYEKVLNITCEPPEKLRCNWTLPFGEKRFKKVMWQPLDWRQYPELIRDFNDSRLRDDLREQSWKENGPIIMKEYKDGTRSIWVTAVDINHNINMEYVVRNRIAGCTSGGTIFGKMVPETHRLDYKDTGLFYHFHIEQRGGEIITYYGKPFFFVYGSVPKCVSIFGYYRKEQCRFIYKK